MKTLSDEDATKLICVRIPVDLHKRLKVLCVENGVSLQQIIVELVGGYLDVEKEVET